MTIRDRIKELRRVPASDLRANPRNWRRHPEVQQRALQGVLAEIGFADAVIARETPDGLELVDGHLRKDIMGDQEVPVLIVDVTEAEADKMLVTLDPLAAMAQTDSDALLPLLEHATFEDQAVTDLLEALANGERLPMPDLTGYPGLADGDKSPLGQMTFTVTDSQRNSIEAALTKAKRASSFDGTGNENSNGNALALIAMEYERS